mgnify:FL=1
MALDLDHPPLGRPLMWAAGSRKEFVSLPLPVRRKFGLALGLAQRGSRHASAKALRGFEGGGVIELLADDVGGTYRAVYTVRFEVAIFVLLVFQKKSKRGIETPLSVVRLIHQRLKAAGKMAQELRDAKAANHRH